LEVGGGLKFPTAKPLICYEMLQTASNLDRYFGTT
jgi:hypothetical protein